MYIKRIVGCFLGQLILLLALQPAAANDYWMVSEAPTWVEQAQPDLARSPSTEAVDFLLADSQVNLTSESPVQYRHYSYRINDSLGVEENSDIEIGFNPDFETIILHHVHILRDNKVIDRLKAEDIRVTDLEPDASSRIYSGYKQLALWLKGVSAGDVVDYSYSVKGHNPVFAGHVSYFFDLGWSLDVGAVNVRVITKRERPLNYRLINSDASVSTSSHGSEIEYRVALKNTAAVIDEGDGPQWEAIYPYLQVSDFDSWQQVAEWAVALFERGKGKLSPDLVEYIQELKLQPRQQAIENAIAFSQEKVRYLGIEIAENSHLPHSPAEVFENRYGDCKDKSLLLVTILNQLGVEANPVLVSTQQTKSVGNYLPTYGLFNHAIATFSYQGQRYWVDPTMTHQGIGLDSYFQPDYGDALIVSKQTDSLTMMPNVAPAQQSIAVTQQYHASDYLSPVVWRIRSEYRGREAESMRYQFARAGKKRLAQDYFNYYAQLNEGLEVMSDLTVEDDRVQNRMVISEEYLLPNFWKLDDGNANFGFYADLADSYLKLPQQVNRSQHLGIYGPILMSQKMELWLPEHINFIWEDEQKVIENDFIRYTIDLSAKYRKLILEHSYQTKLESVPPSSVSEHIRVLREAREYLEYSNGVNNVTSDPSYDEVKALVSHIQKQQKSLRQ
ncbi:DUF3857 domain-containing transglutaminase family protein [Corallincola holothuriorum]|nr:DUF3857 domain-containing transglutaminase family protein [Corallincola holothuriorum]